MEKLDYVFHKQPLKKMEEQKGKSGMAEILGLGGKGRGRTE